MATTTQQMTRPASPLEQLEDLEAEVLEYLPANILLTIHGVPMTQEAIVDELDGWHAFLEGYVGVVLEAQDPEELRPAGALLGRGARAFAREVRFALEEYLGRPEEPAAPRREAKRPPRPGAPQCVLAAVKRPVTSELRGLGSGERPKAIPTGKPPRVR
jgi:hypothetical protein